MTNKAGKKLVVGAQALNQETPKAMKTVMRLLAFLSGVWAILPQDLINLTDEHYGMVNKWIIVANTVVLFAIKFFGWKNPNEE